jgi:hypothetical protein
MDPVEVKIVRAQGGITLGSEEGELGLQVSRRPCAVTLHNPCALATSMCQYEPLRPPASPWRRPDIPDLAVARTRLAAADSSLYDGRCGASEIAIR